MQGFIAHGFDAHLVASSACMESVCSDAVGNSKRLVASGVAEAPGAAGAAETPANALAHVAELAHLAMSSRFTEHKLGSAMAPTQWAKTSPSDRDTASAG